MPRNRTILQVFVASPSDLADERASLEDIIKEYNITWSQNLGIGLDLVRWETHAHPGFDKDPQAVLNKQLPADYDIFIGILWTSYGKPTGRAGSGTVEEFEHAYKRHSTDPDSINILFYFKDAPVSPSHVDAKQLESVQEFKEKLGDRGGLYWEFRSLSEFQKYVRIHLNKVAQKWKERLESGRSANQYVASNDEQVALSPQNMKLVEIEEEEPGYLDLIESATEYFTQGSDVATRISDILNDLTTAIEQRTKEFNEMGATAKDFDLKSAKRIANKTADDIENFIRRSKVEFPILTGTLHNGIEAFGDAATLSLDFEPDDEAPIKETLKTISSLRSSVIQIRETMIEFRSSFMNLPRITTAFNRSKRKALELLDDFIRELQSGRSLAEEVEKSITEIILGS